MQHGVRISPTYGPTGVSYTWPASWICIRGRSFPGRWGRRWRRSGYWRLWKRQPLVIHSDRGVQYTCGDYEEATAGMERSYSEKACPWDNACIESFHALIKREWISRFRIIDYSQAYRLVFEYIEAFYNTVRIHSHCGYRSPSEYEKQYLERMEEKMKESG